MQILRFKIYQDINIYKFIYSYIFISYNDNLNNTNGCSICKRQRQLEYID